MAQNIKIEGLEQLQKRISKIRDSVAGDEAHALMVDIAQRGATRLRAEAQSQHWPYKAIDSVFFYGKRRYGERFLTTLFGIRKRGRKRPFAPAYVEWGKRAGKLIGESLATMYEYGTSKLSARPAVRPVVAEMKRTVPDRIAEGYKAIIEKAAEGK